MAINLYLLSSNCFVALKNECSDTCIQGLMIQCPNLAQNMLEKPHQTVLKTCPHFGFMNFIIEIPKQIMKPSTVLEIHALFCFFIFAFWI